MRIRSIKPEFWRSNDVSDLSMEDRLLFIGLWSYVDDNGVGVDELHIIIAELFARDHFENPRETVARVSRGLQNIDRNGLVTRYQVAGRAYLYVNTWEQHQRIDKPNKPRYPLPDADRETLATSSRDPREDVAPGTEEQRNRGTEEVGTEEQRNSAQGAAAPPALDLVPSGPSFDDFWATYPRRIDKPAARKAWAKAIKTTNPAEIIAGAAKHREDPNREDAYTKHPATWLNAEAWNNEALPARTTGRESSLARRDRQVQTTLAELAAMENNGQGAITA